MSTVEGIVKGRALAQALAAEMIRRKEWFEVEALPQDEYQFTMYVFDDDAE